MEVPDALDPQQLPEGLGVMIYGADCAQLANALTLLADFLAGRVPPAVSKQARFTKRLETARAAFALAAQSQAQAKFRAAALAAVSAQPSPVVSVLLPSAQAAEVCDVVTVAEAADLLGLSHERIRQLAASGRIRGQRTARRVWMLERASVASHRTRRQRSATHGSKPDH